MRAIAVWQGRTSIRSSCRQGTRPLVIACGRAFRVRRLAQLSVVGLRLSADGSQDDGASGHITIAALCHHWGGARGLRRQSLRLGSSSDSTGLALSLADSSTITEIKASLLGQFEQTCDHIGPLSGDIARGTDIVDHVE